MNVNGQIHKAFIKGHLCYGVEMEVTVGAPRRSSSPGVIELPVSANRVKYTVNGVSVPHWMWVLIGKVIG